MNHEINPIATHHLPSFIPAPGQTDGLLVGIGLFLLVVVFLLGIAFLWLHSLPERIAHKSQKLQFEVVAILCLLALFTRNNLLWGAALLLAFIDIPDLATPLGRISDALDRLVGVGRRAAMATASADGAVTEAASAPDSPETSKSAPSAGETTTGTGH